MPNKQKKSKPLHKTNNKVKKTLKKKITTKRRPKKTQQKKPKKKNTKTVRNNNSNNNNNIYKHKPEKEEKQDMMYFKTKIQNMRIFTNVESEDSMYKLIRNRTIITNKSGGYSLLVEKKKVEKIGLYIGDPCETILEKKAFAVTGLISYYSNGIIWPTDRNRLPLPNKNKRNTSPDFIKMNKTPENEGLLTKGPNYGIERGIVVHEEIESFINYGADIFSEICPFPNMMTICIMKALGERGYTGLFSEYPVVFNAKNGEVLASSIDAICFDKKNNKLVLVEIKTGYSDGSFFYSFKNNDNNNNNNSSKYEKNFTKTKMLGRFNDLVDCPINRSRIQICSYLYYFRSFLKIKCEGIIVHCDNKGLVTIHNLDDGFYHKNIPHIKSIISLFK